MTLELAREALAAPDEDRYHRQTLISWWDQRRVREARVLVIGAGALGNEILKLLALTGVGRVLVYDPDHIERSNLSRTVLFRERDEGRKKAEVAAERARELNPDVRVHAVAENILSRAGLGVFRWADVVIGGVDNREARVFINSACARTGRAWVDGAIEGLAGVVRAFQPGGDGACYECTMNATDRKLLAERRSCALLARDAVARGHVPTTAVSASVVAGLEVQEAIKILHGQPALLGAGLHLDGMWSESSRVGYLRREDCPGHERLPEAEPLGLASQGTTLGALLDRAEAELGPGAALDLSRDVILRLGCPSCGQSEPGRAVLGAVRESAARCPSCGTHRVVETLSSITRDAGLDLDRTFADLGLPPYDIVLARQGLDEDRRRAWLFDGDAAEAHALGPLATAAPSNPSQGAA